MGLKLKDYLLAQTSYKMMETSINQSTKEEQAQFKADPNFKSERLAKTNKILLALRLHFKVDYSLDNAQNLVAEELKKETDYVNKQEGLRKKDLKELEKEVLQATLLEKKEKGLNTTWSPAAPRPSKSTPVMVKKTRAGKNGTEEENTEEPAKPKSAPGRMETFRNLFKKNNN